jgi:uncharacterized repeat protein (TIGR03803 family)
MKESRSDIRRSSRTTAIAASVMAMAGAMAALPVTASPTAASGYAPVVLQSLSSPAYAPTALWPTPAGNFLGVAPGSDNYGAIVTFGQDGSITPINDVTAYTASTGLNYSSIAQAPGGTLYVSSYSDQFPGTGVLFKLTSDNQAAVLHTFGELYTETRPVQNADGAGPINLIYAADGNLYGLGTYGSLAGGNVFKLAPDGTFSQYAIFDYIHGGPNSPVAMVLGVDQSLYVMTSLGGANDAGAISRVNADGSFTDLYAAPAAASLGQTTAQSLVQTADGTFYAAYATSPQTTVLKLTGNGNATVLPNTFYNDATGVHLFTAADGQVYGSATGGGPFGGGLLFRVTPDAQVQALAFFGFPGTPLSQPLAAAIGSDGNLYGSAAAGGTSGGGATYTLKLPPPANWNSGPAPVVTLKLNRSTLHYPLQKTARLHWTIANTQTCILHSSLAQAPIPISANGFMQVTVPSAGAYYFSLSCGNQGLTGSASTMLEVKG